MTDPASVVIGVATAVVPPASRALRRLLNEREDRQSMTKVLNAAMVQAAAMLATSNHMASPEDIIKVADGAISVARTGSVQTSTKLKRFWQQRPGFTGGQPSRKLQTVGPQEAMDELARWIRASARILEVEPLKSDEYAQLAANIFMAEILTPTPFADTAAFSRKLTKEWLKQAQDASVGERVGKWVKYPALLTAAAAAVGALVGLPGHDLIQLAQAVGAGTILIATGVGFYDHDRDPDTQPQTEAKLIKLVSLVEQINAFLIDLTQLPILAVSPQQPALVGTPPNIALISGNGELLRRPEGLHMLIEDLDQRLLPAARDRAPLLEGYLERVADQLRLLEQQRPSFNLLNLRSAVFDLWETLGKVGYRGSVYVPNPLELPAGREAPQALAARRILPPASPSTRA
jgi:hypothetical protein